jgi:cytochrome P450
MESMTTDEMTVPTLDFDHHAQRTSHHRDEVLELVAPHAIFYTEAYDGFWVVTSNKIAQKMLRDPETFATGRLEDGSGGITIPQVPVPLIPAENDPPHHTVLRKILNPLFSRERMNQLRGLSEEVAQETLDEVVAKRDFDVIADIAAQYPAKVILRYLGVNESDGLMLLHAAQANFQAVNDEERQHAMNVFIEVHAKIMARVAERREDPRDDVISHLVAQPELTDDAELFWLIFTLIAAGTENVGALIANGMLHLHQHPELKASLIADPDLIPAATEEFLRFYTPGGSTVRHVRKDEVDLAGVKLRRGDRVLVWLHGTNHDPEVFDAPEKIQIDRENVGRHMAFGGGTHRCVGAMMGQMEADVWFRALLTRIPDYRIDVERSRQYDDIAIQNGWWEMPARTNLATA